MTGDADAMAYRAGAEITGKEFPDTHYLANYPAWKSNAELYAAYMYFTGAEGRHQISEECMCCDYRELDCLVDAIYVSPKIHAAHGIVVLG